MSWGFVGKLYHWVEDKVIPGSRLTCGCEVFLPISILTDFIDLGSLSP